MIGIIDYDIGNLRSAQKAFEHVGADVRFIRKPSEFAGARDQLSGLVLPGVGAFGDCCKGFRATGLEEAVRAWVEADRPFFGICVGFQMLFDSSEECPDTPGLGFIPGRVVKFKGGTDARGDRLKVPQIGWNRIRVEQPDHPVLADINTGDFVYFVHSYHALPKDDSFVALRSDYGEDFVAAVGRNNLFATQFHPEKSQERGLKLISNFVAMAQATAATA